MKMRISIFLLASLCFFSYSCHVNAQIAKSKDADAVTKVNDHAGALLFKLNQNDSGSLLMTYKGDTAIVSGHINEELFRRTPDITPDEKIVMLCCISGILMLLFIVLFIQVRINRRLRSGNKMVPMPAGAAFDKISNKEQLQEFLLKNGKKELCEQIQAYTADLKKVDIKTLVSLLINCGNTKLADQISEQNSDNGKAIAEYKNDGGKNLGANLKNLQENERKAQEALQSCQAALQSAQKKLADAEDEFQKKLDDAKAELRMSNAKWNESQDELKLSRTSYDETLSKFKTSQAALEQKQRELSESGTSLQNAEQSIVKYKENEKEYDKIEKVYKEIEKNYTYVNNFFSNLYDRYRDHINSIGSYNIASESNKARFLKNTIELSVFCMDMARLFAIPTWQKQKDGMVRGNIDMVYRKIDSIDQLGERYQKKYKASELPGILEFYTAYCKENKIKDLNVLIDGDRLQTHIENI